MPEMRVNFAEFPPHRRFPKRNASRQHKMSGMGHEQTSRHVRVMSGASLKADIHQRGLHVRLVPKAELFYSPDGGAGHGWSGVMIFTMPLTKFQTATASALELTMTTIVVFSEGR